MIGRSFLHHIYYHCKPLIPRSVQLLLRRWVISRKVGTCGGVWPIDPRAGAVPKGWKGWPGGKRFALLLSHDVDTAGGQLNSLRLAEEEMRMGFRSSFNFVPERYRVSGELRGGLVERGFEVAVHGLVHDGRLFLSRRIFRKRAPRINRYLREWGSVGFHAPSMQRNLEWILELDIEYAQSTFDTDPFEPEPEGVSTTFPFWVGEGVSGRGYVELPYTLPQDHCLFILMRERENEIWKRKLDWVAETGGVALLKTHPDYMDFDAGGSPGRERYRADLYFDFLEYARTVHEDRYWHVVPRELARFWRKEMVTNP